MIPSANNRQELQYTATLTRFYRWLEEQKNSKPFKNIHSSAQSINKQKSANHLPPFSECMNFCNRLESI